jgi:isopentenyldiphosphate isomerase
MLLLLSFICWILSYLCSRNQAFFLFSAILKDLSTTNDESRVGLIIIFYMDELFPLVDEQGNVIGKATRSECHSGTFWLHPVVHLHVLNSAGQLFLQKRAMNKDTQPGKWDTSVGGHVSYGETIEQALQREVFEEIGISIYKPMAVQRYVWLSTVEKELVNTFYTIYDGAFEIDHEEIDTARFWTIDEIQQQIGQGLFTPNFEYDFNLLLLKLHEQGNDESILF